MNEKIRALAEQARHSPDSFDKYCKTLHPLWNTHISRTYAEQFFHAGLNAQLDLEKFAELIVTECVTKLKETKKVELPFIQAVNEHAQELPLSVYIAELKQHFGVEE
jgi:hypothetical protein